MDTIPGAVAQATVMSLIENRDIDLFFVGRDVHGEMVINSRVIGSRITFIVPFDPEEGIEWEAWCDTRHILVCRGEELRQWREERASRR